MIAITLDPAKLIKRSPTIKAIKNIPKPKEDNFVKLYFEMPIIVIHGDIKSSIIMYDKKVTEQSNNIEKLILMTTI